MAGAYRCPNCGIDFPTGTPGAPRAAQSPADTDPGGRRSDAPQPPSSAVNIAERLESALVELTGPPPPPPPQDKPEPPRATAEVIDVVPEPTDDEGTRDLPRSAELRTVPGGPGREGRAEPSLGFSADPSRRGSNLAVSPKRGSGAPLIAEPEPRELVPTRRRRRSSGLGGTIATAVVLLGLVGAGAWWVNERGVAESLTNALVPTIAAPEPLVVSAEEGWVRVPPDMGAFSVSADGPFRVRIGSEVYTARPADTLRVEGAGSESVAVRAIRAPTTVRVTPDG